MGEINRNLPLVDLVTMQEQIAKEPATREDVRNIRATDAGIRGVGAFRRMGLYRDPSSRMARRGDGAKSVSVWRSARCRQMCCGWSCVKDWDWPYWECSSGIPVVWLGAKYVEKELTGMKPVEPLSVGLALGILLVAALVAVGIPAGLRAAALQPADTLRQERGF